MLRVNSRVIISVVDCFLQRQDDRKSTAEWVLQEWESLSAGGQVRGEINTQEPSETLTEREKLSHTVQVHGYDH